MILYLIRHATAQEPALHLPDPIRHLTAKGYRQVQTLAAFCRAQLVTPDVLLTSPLLRARQTAEYLHLHANWPEAEAKAWLIIDTQVAVQYQAVMQLVEQGLSCACCVGHEPDISALLAYMLNAEASSFQIKKASISAVRFTPNQVVLLWSLPVALM